MRLLTVDGHWRVRRDQPGPRPLDIEAGLVAETPRRWLRLFAVWGDAPGSWMMGRHWAAGRTVNGWCARAGWWPGPCLTLIAQARPAEDPWALAVAEMPRRPLPWDDPGQMAADIRQAIRGIRECGGPGVFP